MRPWSSVRRGEGRAQRVPASAELGGAAVVNALSARRKLPHADVGQTEGGLPALDPRPGHACGGERPRRQGRAASAGAQALGDARI